MNRSFVLIPVLTTVFAISGLAGAHAQRPAAAPGRTIVTPEETLRGQTAMSIGVFLAKDIETGAAEVAADVRAFLERSGITVLADGAVPQLRVIVTTLPANIVGGSGLASALSNSYYIFSLQLEFVQEVGLGGEPSRLARAITWRDANVGFTNMIGARAFVAEQVRAVMGRFTAAYTAVNPTVRPGTATSRADSPAVAAPQLVDGFLDYGSVIETFVPPTPQDLSSGRTAVRMSKRLPGSLIEVHFLAVDFAVTASGSNPYAMPGDIRDRVVLDMRALPPTQRILRCVYRLEADGRVQQYLFWHLSRPPEVNPAQLRTRAADHPLLRFKEPVGSCPVSVDAARSAP
jgi:hypothetical protein